jgi:ABC-2 type transport system permease protein
MADIGVAGEADLTSPSGGIFSRLARVQYAALTRMRASLFVNAIRSGAGAIEFSARAVSFAIYCFIGVAIGAGAGATMYSLLSANEWSLVSVEFWVLCVVWQAISIALASFQEQFDLTGLLRFPVNFGSFVLLHLIFGLIDIPSIIGGLCSLGVLIGAAIARPDLTGWAALAIGLFVAFNMLLARAILAWLDRWLAKRRSREIVTGLFLMGVLGLQLLNPAFHGQDGEDRTQDAEGRLARHEGRPLIDPLSIVQGWLPPGAAANALRHAEVQDASAALGWLGLIGLYGMGASGLLALRLRAEYRGESLDEAPSRRQAAARESAGLSYGGPIAAVIEKELRTLTRSMPQLYALGVPMLMVFIIGNVFHTTAVNTRHPFQLAFPACVAYGLLGFIQLIYNNLGAEGSGIQLLLLSPTRMRTILLAKNLCHGGLFVLVATASAVLASLRLGRPGTIVAATTVAWLAFALPANLAAGNIMSLTMPYRVNLGRLGKQAGSQANAMLSMLIQATLLGVGAGVISLCTMLGKAWYAAIALAVLAVCSALGWLVVLRKSDGLAAKRRDQLISRLAKVE